MQETASTPLAEKAPSEAQECVDVDYLRKFQSEVVQYQAFLDDFTKKKQDMLDRVAMLNRLCYKEKIHVVSILNGIKEHIETRSSPPRRLLCANEKEYLGAILSYLLKLLTMLKEDKKLFALFISALPTAKGVTDKDLNILASDLVYLFFSDFTSNERSILNILRQFRHLIQNMFIDYKAGHNALFDEPLFINKLIDAYLKRSENREYLHLLFGKIMDNLYNANRTNEESLEKASEEQRLAAMSEVLTRKISTNPDGNAKADGEADRDQSLRRSLTAPKTAMEEEKLVFSELDNEEMMNVCKELLASITKKLIYMPLSMRYLCKLVEKLALKHIVIGDDREKVVRKVILDIIFKKWWSDALKHPHEYGITKVCIMEGESSAEINAVNDLLEKVFYGTTVDAHLPFAKKINEFITAEQPKIDEYLRDLLAVDLPSMTIGKPDEHALVLSSVCMSLESVKRIYDIMKGKVAEVEAIKPLFVKYLERVQIFLDNPQGIQSSMNISIFEPTEGRFGVEPMGKEGAPTKEEFKNAQHYILFQDISICEKKKDELLAEKWQQSLHRLLLDIDLSSYYNKNLRTEKCDGQYKIDLFELLQQINKYPSGFMVSPEKSVKVKLLASSLLNYFSAGGEKTARANMEKLKKTYTEIVGRNATKQQQVEHNLRMAISAISSRMSSIKETSRRAYEVVLSGIYAGEFIKKQTLAFEIKKEVPKPPKDKKTPPIPLDQLKYTVVLCDPQPKTVTAKKLANAMFFGAVKSSDKKPAASAALQHPSNIVGFINEYSKMKELKDLLHTGEDKFSVGKIFKEFIKYINKKILEDPASPKDLKENMIDHVYQYIMSRLHPKIFPTEPSEADNMFYFNVSNWDWLLPEEFNVKPELRHEEQWKLALKKLKLSEKVSTPQEKLDCYTDAFRIIGTAVEIFSADQKAGGAEDCAPVLFYLVLKATPRLVFTTINYIDIFRVSRETHERDEYSYTTFKAAVKYLHDLKPDPKKKLQNEQTLKELQLKSTQFKSELSEKILEQSGPQ